MLIHTDERNFDKIKNSSKLFLLDFFATWCGPCHMLGAELEKVAKSHDDFDIVKIDTDENMSLARTFGVEVLPTLFIFKDGKPVKRLEGYMPAETIVKFMENFK